MAKPGSSKPRRGRPPKAGAAKRASFNTRIRDSLKASLEEAARDAGRSLSEEIEFRLEREQTLAAAMASALGGNKAAALFLELAAEARLWGDGERWLDDYSAFNTVRARWEALLDRATREMPYEIKHDIDGWGLAVELTNSGRLSAQA